jgi:RNA polymerase sigma factor (sigma-70 family)
VSLRGEAWLVQRAANGDQLAFETLLTAIGSKLRRVAAVFVSSETTVDDLVQIVLVKLWREVKAGHYNPARAPFAAFASTVAHQACIDDRIRRRAAKRWADEPPVSLDIQTGSDGDDSSGHEWVAPSWAYGADPLAVVLQREQLREAWEALTAGELEAVQLYLATDGIGAPKTAVTAFYEARKRVRPILAA